MSALKPDFQADGVTLYCGDCREIVPALRGVDAIVTDPPFGIGFAAQPTKWQRRARQVPQAWDDSAPDVSFLLSVTDGPVVIWGGNYFSLPISRGWLSWFKPDAPPSMGNVELAWTNQDQNMRQISHSISATNAERVGHPTQKPYRVTAWSIQLANVPEGATVLDPYMGSGTTGIACIRTGRKFIGIEKDPAHFATAVARIERELAQGVLAL